MTEQQQPFVAYPLPNVEFGELDPQQKQACKCAKHWLQQQWPKVFPANSPNGVMTPVPLAIGSNAQIMAKAPPELVPAIKMVLERHVVRKHYLRALRAPAARRMTLDGEDAGPVIEGHKFYARAMLKLIAANERRIFIGGNKEG
jgi:hypothetical protein